MWRKNWASPFPRSTGGFPPSGPNTREQRPDALRCALIWRAVRSGQGKSAEIEGFSPETACSLEQLCGRMRTFWAFSLNRQKLPLFFPRKRGCSPSGQRLNGPQKQREKPDFNQVRSQSQFEKSYCDGQTTIGRGRKSRLLHSRKRGLRPLPIGCFSPQGTFQTDSQEP